MTTREELPRGGRTLTLYRDDSTVQVVYANVKAVFWTAGNTVLVVSQYTTSRLARTATPTGRANGSAGSRTSRAQRLATREGK